MRLKSVWEVLRDTGSRFSQDRVTTLGAALAYYAIFSIAPLLVILISVAGLVFGEQGARHQMIQQIQGVVGQRSAGVIDSMMASQTKSGSWIATAIGIVVLLLGASGIFSQLKASLNLIWHVQPRPGRGILGMVWDRFVALLVVLGIGLLLVCTMLLSTVV
ncbi:MAG TPA: YhjD/YihY/BrkB family envelope integrity protein, partial [Verrucomicrobiae bacterium]|nr:YhjD/YihY/BrkB family envelope integrity protein [Verrucomicrobiae bacterium]